MKFVMLLAPQKMKTEKSKPVYINPEILIGAKRRTAIGVIASITKPVRAIFLKTYRENRCYRKSFLDGKILRFNVYFKLKTNKKYH